MEQLPGVAAEISILHLFWKADWVVKLVMMGLLAASVGVWAIAIDKFILYRRTRQAMKHFENVFWSGQSLEDLYRALAARPTDSSSGPRPRAWIWCVSAPPRPRRRSSTRP